MDTNNRFVKLNEVSWSKRELNKNKRAFNSIIKS